MSKKGSYYITTPIYYPSDRLHIGHAYTTTVADSLARFQRFAGKEVFFLTGSDEHGQKIQRIAKEKGVSPQAYVDGIVAGFKELWERLGISYDGFIRTTEERHHKTVQEVFRRLKAQGDIYKDTYKGWYCTPCETFWTERQLSQGNCPDCGRPVETVQEESYFFRLSKYADRLLAHIDAHPEFIQPESRRNEMVSFVKQGLEDLCVSRTTFDWGIQVPDDPKHVVYVWLDALTNYLTGIGFLEDSPTYRKFWPADLHLVGKEIMRFHTIIWPIALMALDLPLPKVVFGHGWLTSEGDKMSKSKGNVIDPNALMDEFGVDAIRYFLLREFTLGYDGNYSRVSMIKRINSDLANDLGNLLHRTGNMVTKYFGGSIPAPGPEEEIDLIISNLAQVTVEKVQKAVDAVEPHTALIEIWTLIGRANKYIDETAPWAVAKAGNEPRLARILYTVAETLRVTALLLAPFMPSTGQAIWERLGLTDFQDKTIEDALFWNQTPVGAKINHGEPLFPRIELEEKEEKVAPPVPKPEPEPAPLEDLISIEDFAKVQLRVGTIKQAERVEGADKLLKLQVDLGQEVRQIVAGIALFYSPEELIGKQVVIVANLKPVKLRGNLSQGMILAASTPDKKQLVIIGPSGPIPPGSSVS